jgi:hypothetical protein
MKCKICNQNETDNSSGICVYCITLKGNTISSFCKEEDLEGKRADALGSAVLDNDEYYIDHLGIIRKHLTIKAERIKGYSCPL